MGHAKLMVAVVSAGLGIWGAAAWGGIPMGDGFEDYSAGDQLKSHGWPIYGSATSFVYSESHPFSGTKCAAAEAGSNQANKRAFNTNPDIGNQRVWLEAYVYSTVKGYGEVGFVKPEDGTSRQAAIQFHSSMQVRLRRASSTISADNCPWVLNQFYHVVMEFDYPAGKGKLYLRAVDQGDTRPLTEDDVVTFSGGSLTFDLEPGSTYAGVVYMGVYYSSKMYVDGLRVTATDPTAPATRTLTGMAAIDGYRGDNATVAVRVDLTNTGEGGNLSRTVLLGSDGRFELSVPKGVYNVSIKTSNSLSETRTGVDLTAAADLGTIELKGADFNGDDQVTFEDFALLQNNYGQSGPVAMAPRVAHAVDGTLSAGEWANWYSDPIGDNGTGDVDLVGWATEVQNGVLYAAFQLNPNGPTVAAYDDYQGDGPFVKSPIGHYLWAGLGIDVDPDTIPATGVAANNPFPVPLDICPELGMDQGGLLPTDPVVWNSLNLWGDGNDFAGHVPVTPVVAAYQGYVLEYAVPISAITAELPNTDNAIPANVWKIGARLAAHGFGGSWSGDITDLQSVPVAGVGGRVTIPGYQGDPALVGVRFDFAPVGGGSTITRRIILNSDGTFRLDGTAPGTYDVTVTSPGMLSTVLANVSVPDGSADLGMIELVNADADGDGRVGFEDFSILQNSYGRSGLAAAAETLPGGLGGCSPLGMVVLIGLALCTLGACPLK